MVPSMRTIEDRLAVIVDPTTAPTLRASLAVSEVAFLRCMISCSRFDGQLRESPLSRTYVDQLRICQIYLDTLSPSNTNGDLLGNLEPSLFAERDVDRSGR
ncbi:unnamed protein product [Linum trigynum]|uniref:Uncharacterized protein n=1 Tax=Linum trigynum TaxID=586398 RepID=A0AAV2DUQ5_9ROSI